jgi:hypothetical protein
MNGKRKIISEEDIGSAELYDDKLIELGELRLLLNYLHQYNNNLFR